MAGGHRLGAVIAIANGPLGTRKEGRAVDPEHDRLLWMYETMLVIVVAQEETFAAGAVLATLDQRAATTEAVPAELP